MKEDNKKIKKAEARYEVCALCRRRLNIPFDREIDFRPYYIEGAGQLCYDCYHQVYG